MTGAGREFLVYAKKAVGQYEILEDRYLSKDMDKEHFSVSTQHYNFAIKAFTEVIKQLNPDKYVFSIHETKTREVLEDVRNLKSEVGIVSFSGATEAVIIKLFREYQLEFLMFEIFEMTEEFVTWAEHLVSQKPMIIPDTEIIREINPKIKMVQRFGLCRSAYLFWKN